MPKAKPRRAPRPATPRLERSRPTVFGRIAFAAALALATLGIRPALAAGPVESPASELRTEHLAPRSPSTPPHRFEQLPPARTGIDFVYQWNRAPRYERLLNSSAVGGGVAIGDFDNDRLPDLCLTRPAGGYCLYRNLGDLRFTNVTERAGLRDDAVWSTGASFVDINGDGKLDLYVCCYDSPNRLYLNNGDGTFREAAKAHGLAFNGASLMMAFADYDRDGHLDGYLLTGGLIPQPSQRFRVNFVNGRPTVPPELQEYWQIFYLPGDRAAAAEAGQFDHLYHNNGNGTFSDVGAQLGITGCDFGNAIVWWDDNADGWPDLYVANDYFGPDRLYRNRGKEGFRDVARTALPHTPWTSMGASIGDVNNDGRIDLIASDMSGRTHRQRMVDMIDMEKSAWFLEWAEPRQYMHNALFLNSGTDRFLEAAYLAGLADTDWTWSILFGDLDEDGRLDVFVPNGMTRDWMDTDLALQAKALPPTEFTRFWQAQPVRADRNLAFQNLGDLRFQEVSQTWGLNQAGPSFGAALADLDGDGDLDLVVNDFEAPARVLRNQSQENHRAVIRLQGAGANRLALGATVRLQAGTHDQMRYLSPAQGFMSSSEPVLHFGLGQAEQIDTLRIDWPSGRVSRFHHLPVDRGFTVTEPDATATEPDLTPPMTTMFVPSTKLAAGLIPPTSANDFAQQPLLPWKVSDSGSGMAWSDIDADGDDDLYIGGKPTQAGRLFRNVGEKGFSEEPQPAPPPTATERAPLFFDANGDGTPDLFISSGGLDAATSTNTRSGRLLINDGQGHFAPAPDGALPNLHGDLSVAIATDFDRDGDLDLFVGARSVPGQYPATPDSYLLRNDGGHFSVVTDDAAPGLRQAGLVTSAVWSDVDDDGWQDLLVACEWGPVRLFRNEHGRLAERTREAGLADHLGWWQSIAAGDVDHDGDIDYIVTNLGWNTRYQAGPGESYRLYSTDTPSNLVQLVEAKATPQGLLPLRGRSQMTMAIPDLEARIPTHHRYAEANLETIVGADWLRAAKQHEANNAASSVLLNDGHGLFTLAPLPRLAQIAPAYGAALADLDADGWLDLMLAQNHFGVHPETGRMDGGVSLLLMGTGPSAWTPVWPDRSGINVPGEGRSLTIADVNHDERPDVLIGTAAGEWKVFDNAIPKTNRALRVMLWGRPGNPTGVGSRVTLKFKQGATLTAEMRAGGGWLSQSESAIRFGLGTDGQPDTIQVRWPTGATTSHKVVGHSPVVRLKE